MPSEIEPPIQSPTATQLARYQAGARHRAAEKRQRQMACHQRGRVLAQQAAQRLKQRWGASRVVLFGSLLHPEKVHSRSDIDLAVWGLPEADYLKALAELLELDPDFSIDLVEAKDANSRLQAAIQTGVEL